jgi:hypothetical protein
LSSSDRGDVPEKGVKVLSPISTGRSRLRKRKTAAAKPRTRRIISDIPIPSPALAPLESPFDSTVVVATVTSDAFNVEVAVNMLDESVRDEEASPFIPPADWFSPPVDDVVVGKALMDVGPEFSAESNIDVVTTDVWTLTDVTVPEDAAWPGCDQIIGSSCGVEMYLKTLLDPYLAPSPLVSLNAKWQLIVPVALLYANLKSCGEPAPPDTFSL